MDGRKRIRKSHRGPTVNYGRKALDPLPQRLAPRPIDGKLADRKSGAAKRRADWRGEATRAPQAKTTRRSGARTGKEREQKARTKERGRRDGRSGRIEATAQGKQEACDEAQRRLAGTAASSGRRRPATRQRGNAAVKGGAGRRTRGEASKAQNRLPLSVRAATRPAHEPFAPSQSKRAAVACMDAIRTFPKRARENPPEDV